MHSRYLLRCQALPRTGVAQAWPVLDAAFREFGLPERLRSDNGPPFAARGAGGLSQLADGADVDRSLKMLATVRGFTPDDVIAEVSGLCASCSGRSGALNAIGTLSTAPLLAAVDVTGMR